MPVLIIAEAGMNHDGSLGNAKRLIDSAAECGADAVKFQLHDADAETTRDAPAPGYFTSESRYEYFHRTAFSDPEWAQLRDHCQAAGIEFVCSAFSIEAVERLEAIGVARHKVPSGEVTNLPLIERMASGGRPLLLSSGMSTWAELDAAVTTARSHADDVTVMQCTSAYPCPPERAGLNLLAELRERYDAPVGLSDHTLGNAASVAAVALGATAIEKHFTLSRLMYGPDAALAMEPDELTQLVREIRELERMLASPIDKDREAEELAEMKRVFEKSVVTLEPLKAGQPIERRMLGLKKPGTGLPPQALAGLVGQCATRDLPADHLLSDGDVRREA